MKGGVASKSEEEVSAVGKRSVQSGEGPGEAGRAAAALELDRGMGWPALRLKSCEGLRGVVDASGRLRGEEQPLKLRPQARSAWV